MISCQEKLLVHSTIPLVLFWSWPFSFAQRLLSTQGLCIRDRISLNDAPTFEVTGTDKNISKSLKYIRKLSHGLVRVTVDHLCCFDAWVLEKYITDSQNHGKHSHPELWRNESRELILENFWWACFSWLGFWKRCCENCWKGISRSWWTQLKTYWVASLVQL